ncbi:hypothetical protein ACH4JS_27815 [Streptomyces sp. NPDC017638]|uniref:hypothetical protein n=1 Tax=Streptomyces sp. NPDC017638 TaxID=3365004 RepID=UPI0037987973
MAWRDRLRRRSAGTEGPRRGEHDGAPAAAVSGAPVSAAPDAPAAAVPADWDGGWRRTAPPEPTVSRAPLAVSDGLAFRSGLAAWQNPSFDSGLAHALLPTAPTGLVHGVTHRPAAPRSDRAEGGPLLLRALRREGDQEPADGAPDGSATSGPASAAVRPSRASRGRSTGERRPDGGSPSRALASTESSAVPSSSAPAVQRSAEPGTGPVVSPAGPGRRPAAPQIPLVRRVTPVPGAVTGEARSGRAGDGRPQASRTAGADAPRPVVRARPAGPSLTVARRPAGPARRVPALRPTAPDRAAPGTPVRPAAEDRETSVGTTSRAGAEARPADPAPGTATRAPLGAPLTELPPTARPLTNGDPVQRAASGPALPVVQRQTDGASGTSGAYDGGTRGPVQRTPDVPSAPNRPPARGGARARGGLGAPLPELPPSAAVPGASGPGGRRAGVRPERGSGTTPDQGRTPTGATPRATGGNGTGTPLPGPGAVQRRPAADSADRGSSEAAAPSRPGTGSDAPLLGKDVVQRGAAADPDGTSAPETGRSSHSGSGLEAPLVEKPAVRRSAVADAGASESGRPARSGSGADVPLLGKPAVQRSAVADPGTPETGRSSHSGSGLEAPLVEKPAVRRGAVADAGASEPGRPARSGSADVPVSAKPAVQRSAVTDPGTPESGGPSRSGRSAVADTGASEPGRPARSGSGADAPLLGKGAVPRGLAADSADRSTPRPGETPPHSGNGPATPLVTAPRTTTDSPGPAAAVSGSPASAAGRAGDPRRPGARPGSAGTPVVVARAVADGSSGTPGARRPGPAGQPPLTMARSAPAAPPTLSLLAARPLTLNTRPPAGAAAPAAPRPAGRPVVPARWPGTPAPAHNGPAAPARPGPAPAAPPVQRAALAHPGPQAPAAPAPAPAHPVHRAPGPAGVRPPAAVRTGHQSAPALQRVPVVRPAPPRAQSPAPAASAPARSLPVTAPQAPPLADRPAGTPAPAPAAPVPVVRWKNPARTGAGGGAAPVVQRAGEAAEPAAPKRGRHRSATVSGTPSGTSSGTSSRTSSGSSSRTSSASGKDADRRSSEAPPDPGLDLDDLARRLLDPVARLLRAELRRGRDRTGRPHDGRR